MQRAPLRESVYDESPIGLAGNHCDDPTRSITMGPDINTAQRSGGATNYNEPLFARISRQRNGWRCTTL